MPEPANESRIVIVGAGHAGDAAASLLRQLGHHGPLTLLGDEPFRPYHRPPLSKAWLKGEIGEAKLELRSAELYAREVIALRLGVSVTAIDRAVRCVRLAGGDAMPYDHLVLATGARARPLPIAGADLSGVMALRTRADADALKGLLGPGKRAVLIGGGYIGLEIAASARALGAGVTVLERESRLLARVASPELGAFFLDRHCRAGVEIRLGAQVSGIEGQAGNVTGVRMASGELLPADVVLIGIGALPNEELAKAAGLACDDGIVVDAQAATSDPHIRAIGDCTRRPVPHYGRSMRLESVPSALEQAKQAAAAILGRPAVTADVPWFWSDQYEVRLQIAGLLLDVVTTVARGDVASGKFALFHLGATGAVQTVEAVNMPEAYMAGRLLIASRKPVRQDQLADIGLAMKDLVRG
jgi:3-phenylpropionate/trans-cinnamate dioxygenase ferredoxin reductase component